MKTCALNAGLLLDALRFFASFSFALAWKEI